MEKKKVAVLFGGQSTEHVVSCMSASNVIELIDEEQYDIILIGITQDGRWLKVETADQVRSGEWVNSSVQAVISPDAADHGILIKDGAEWSVIKVDVVFPVLHGLYGEDGTIQGLLELARIPYVGCGVLASGISMDKLFTKIIVGNLGIRQAEYVPVMAEELKDMDDIAKKIEYRFNYPVFIKPSNSGSSRGISKAENREQLTAGLWEAAKHDRKILVEEMIHGREIECAVFGGGSEEVRASGVGEILAAADFYDFDAKYYNSESKTKIHPSLPGDLAEEIRDAAVAIFNAVDGYGLSRVDFFVENSGEIVFNEINTMPGFTAISMYPMLWEAKGMDKKALIQALIENGLNRYQ